MIPDEAKYKVYKTVNDKFIVEIFTFAYSFNTLQQAFKFLEKEELLKLD